MAYLPLEEMEFGVMPCTQKSLEKLLESCHVEEAKKVADSRYRQEVIKLLGEDRAKKVFKEHSDMVHRASLRNPLVDKD